MPIIRVTKQSGSVPTISQLEIGDIAINTYDGRAFIKKKVGLTQTVVELGAGVNAISASYALTASYLEGFVTSASYALSASYADSSSYALSSLNAQDILVYCKNQSGYTITKGMVVRITGSNNSSDIPRIVSASYENDNNSANTLGIANETITNGNDGYVMTEGVLKGIDTNAYISGQLLYLGPTGSITGSAPRAPLHNVRLGEVIRHQSNNGSIYVRIDNGYELGELHDILDNTTTSSYGDLLVKSGSLWTNSRQLTGLYSITGSLIISGSSTFTNIGPAILSGSVTGTSGFTGSFTGSLTGTSSYATQAGNTNTININSFSSPVESYLLMSNVVATTEVGIGGDTELRYNSSTNVLTVPSITSSFTGSLLGTSSFAQTSVTASYVLNAVSSSYSLSSSFAMSSSRAVSSSYALSASFAPQSPSFPFTGSAGISGSLAVTENITASIVSATNNGNGTNFRVGDDAWIGDINVANTLQVMGQQNSNQGYIKFGSGSSNPILGANNSTTLALTGNLTTTGTINNVTLDDSAWAPYGIIWSSDATPPNIGNGTLEGYFKQIGKTVFVKVNLFFGTTTTGGTGAWYFSLPVNAKNAYGIQFPCSILDNGLAWYQGTVNGTYGGFTDKTAVIVQSAGGANSSQALTSTHPVTFGNLDSVQFNGSYEAL